MIMIVHGGASRAYRVDEAVNRAQEDHPHSDPQESAIPTQVLRHFRQDPEEADADEGSSAEWNKAA
jgi:hypothetical protein